MSRKHYRALADAIGRAFRDAERELEERPHLNADIALSTAFERLMSEITVVLSDDNPRFSRSRFEDAVALAHRNRWYRVLEIGS